MLQVCDTTANITLMCRLQTLKQVFDLTPNAYNHSQNKRAANTTTGAGKSQKEALIVSIQVFGHIT